MRLLNANLLRIKRRTINLYFLLQSRNLTKNKKCSKPKEKKQSDFAGLRTNKKDEDICFLARIDRFSKCLTVEALKKTNGAKVVNCLNEVIQINGVPQTIQFDRARWLRGKEVKKL